MNNSFFRGWIQWLGALAFLVLPCQLASAGDDSMTVAARPFLWFRQSLNLPNSVRLYQGFGQAEGGAPLRAWYADIDTRDKNLQIVPFLSQSASGRELASAMSKKAGALLSINGGYFDMQGVPAKTFSLVMREGRVLVPNIARVLRTNGRYPVTRGAFGVRADGTFDIAWIAHIADANGATQTFAYDEPTRNTPSQIADAPSATFPLGARLWDAQNAVGGGPVLISDGKIVDTYSDEAFFGAGFPSALPYGRAAVGYTKDNRLIFFVVDAKQPQHSVGLTLARLSEELQKLGCVEALNLDGGGSAALVAEGRVLNRPSDGRERDVSSILAIVPRVKTAIVAVK